MNETAAKEAARPITKTAVTGIYLDHSASTPLAPEAIAAMRPLLEAGFGNPSSGHWASSLAGEALSRARRQVAGLLGCDDDEIIFTSGGTEANNLALKGAWFDRRRKGDHRAGSVCLNSRLAVVKWISASVMPPPGLAWAG